MDRAMATTAIKDRMATAPTNIIQFGFLKSKVHWKEGGFDFDLIHLMYSVLLVSVLSFPVFAGFRCAYFVDA
jgi:hypothetical protein